MVLPETNTGHGRLLLTVVTGFTLLFGIVFGRDLMGEPFRTGQFSTFTGSGTVRQGSGSGQDGDLQAGIPWPVPRFSRHDDGTVTDGLTGLTWLADGACLGSSTWQGAAEKVKRLNSAPADMDCAGYDADYSDWTLPAMDQLETLFNGEEASQAIWLERVGFAAMQRGAYWSATTGANPYSGWTYDMEFGGVREESKLEALHILAVRRGKAPAETAGAAPRTGNGGERFIDNGDGTVTDLASGLMWLADGACLGEGSWQTGLERVAAFNEKPHTFRCAGFEAGYRDWALPNRNELKSLVDPRRALPALPPGAPFEGFLPSYWTSTTVAAEPARAYDLALGSGEVRLTEKAMSRGIWPVRPVAGRPARQRLKPPADDPAAGAGSTLLRPMGEVRQIAWPPSRFRDNGDGTLTDNTTGLMWLKDGDCFLPETWENAAVVVDWLNRNPDKLGCRDYTARYPDWRLPDLERMKELVGGSEGEPAAWLNRQGAVKTAARDYWTADENPLNLYHAWAVNLGRGESHNYPKSFELHTWPMRRPGGAPAIFRPGMKINDQEEVRIGAGQELVLSVSLESEGGPRPARFFVSYEDPDGLKRWLDSTGRWQLERSWFYEGIIFALSGDKLFNGTTDNLMAGEYLFTFTVIPQGAGEEPPPGRSSVCMVEVRGRDETRHAAKRSLKAIP